MTGFAGQVAVVTGAGSGIGRQLAYELAKRGARLAVSDVDDAGLAETAERLAALGAQVHAARLDVTDRAGVAAYAQAVAGHFGVVHVVVNNAGIAAPPRTVLTADYADLQRVIDVNLWGVIHGTKEFLPHLAASGDGRLVNISSFNGLFAQAGLAGYCASKFAVRGFTEVVRAEVLAAGMPVRVCLVHPGGVRTDIVAAALDRAKGSDRPPSEAEERLMRRYERVALRMDPIRAAGLILDGVAAGRPRILLGAETRVADAFVRLVPSGAPRVGARLGRPLRRGPL